METLGLTVMAVVGSTDRHIDDVILAAADDDPQSLRPALVLLAGVRASDDRVPAAVRRLADAGAVAVVLKGLATDVPQREFPVPVIVVEPAASWRELLATLEMTGVDLPHTLAGPLSTIESGDLFALANAVATMAGGAVAIEDADRRILAHSTHPDHPIDEVRQRQILERQLPASYAWAYNQIASATGVIRIQREGHRPRLAIAVRADDRVLGSIWVLEGNAPLGEQAEHALAEAAPAAAMQLLRLHAVHDVDRRNRAETVRGLLLGEDVDDTALAELRLPPDIPWELVAFELAQAPDAAMPLTQLLDVVTVFVESMDMGAISVLLGGRVYAVLPAGDHGRLEQIVTAVRQRAQVATGTEIRAAIGPSAQTPTELDRAREGTDLALRVAQREQLDSHLVTYEELRTKALLLHIADLLEADPELATSPPLTEVLAADTRSTLTTARVLRAYLEAMGHVPTAAEALLLHENTVRHRFRRAEEHLGLDLGDPDERLLLWLQLRLLAEDASALPASATRRPVRHRR